MTAGKELFKPPYSERIVKVLPTLFNMVELENRRGNKLGMEVGTARERVLIAMFMYVYGSDAVKFPPSTSHELDVLVNGDPVSIKTKSGRGTSGVKLIWTVDWDKIDEFVKTYHPTSDLLYVNIVWGEVGKFFVIPRQVQERVLTELGVEQYVKLPRRGTNPRGVEISKGAMLLLQEDPQTQHLEISWQRDPSLLVERTLYDRWITLWDAL